MFEKRRKPRDAGLSDIALAGWCLALVFLVILFLMLAFHAGRASASDRSGDSFGDRAWAGWCDIRPDQGWSFYCDPEAARRRAEAEARQQEQANKEEGAIPPEKSATETIADMRAHLLELRAKAILHSTPENVEAYYREQARFMDLAGSFSDTVRRVLWANPDLDYEAVHPQSNLGKKAAQADLYNNRQQMMASLGQRYGLIYVGTRTCPVCTIYGPHLRQFAARWQLTVLAVSADGSRLSGWPEAVPDRGQLARMQITEDVVPVTALFDKENAKVTLLGVGFLADEELVYRIHTLTTRTTGNSSPAGGG